MGNIENLISNMQEKGLEPNCDPILDGAIQRFSRDPQKPTEKDEWYVGFVLDSGHIHCTFGSWSTSHNFSQTYKSYDSDHQLTAEEIAQIKAIREKAEEERRQAKEKAKKVIQEKLEKAKQPSKSHLYISRKKIIPYGARQLKDHILLPMQNHFGDVTGMEWINPEGLKRTIKGSQKKGSMLPLADMKSTMIIRLAEGWATACSIQEARPNDCAVCCFGLSNIREVAKVLKAKYPNKQIVACIDAGTPESELEALKSICETIEPKLSQNELDAGLNDFNDVHVDNGINELKEQLKPKFLTALSAQNLMRSDYPPIEWRCNAVVQTGGLTVVYSLPGAGKSSFCLDLSVALSNGLWFITGICQKSKVLYVDGEMSGGELQLKLDEVYTRSGLYPTKDKPARITEPEPGYLDFVTLDHLKSLDMEPVNLHFEDHRTLLDGLIENYDVIILDNWFNLCELPPEASGWNDIDRAEKKIISWMRNWQSTGKSFIAVNHSNESGSMYGFKGLVKSATTVISLEPLKAADGFEIYFKKNRNISKNEYWDVSVTKVSEAFGPDGTDRRGWLMDKYFKET